MRKKRLYFSSSFVLELVTRGTTLLLAIVLVVAVESAEPGVLDAPPEEEDDSNERVEHGAKLLMAFLHVGHLEVLEVVVPL